MCGFLAGFITAAWVLDSTTDALAQPKEQKPPIRLPIRVMVAKTQGTQVVTQAWLDAQLAEANRVIGAHGVAFAFDKVEVSTTMTAALETRADRDALGDLVSKQVINVFVVASLRDVDDPSRLRMGVHWRELSNLKNNYIIVSASARRATMAHEIGHYLGNPHTGVENNLMSYKRTDEDAVFMDAVQGARCRRTTHAHIATGKLVRVVDVPESSGTRTVR